MKVTKILLITGISVLVITAGVVSHNAHAGLFDNVKSKVSNNKSSKKSGTVKSKQVTSKKELKTADPASLKVFNENKDQLRTSEYYFMKYKSTDRRTLLKIFPTLNEQKKIAEETIQKLKEGIKEGFEALEDSDRDVRLYGLAKRVIRVVNGIKHAEERRLSFKKLFIEKLDQEIKDFSRAKTSRQVEGGLSMVSEYVSKLEIIIGKNDEDVRKKLKEVDSAVKKQKKIIEKALAKKRMPKNKYSGSNRIAVQVSITKALKKVPYNYKVLRVVLSSNWQNVKEKIYKDGKATTVYYKEVSAYVAIKKKSGVSVYHMSFRKRSKGVTLNSMKGGGFQMLEKNVYK